MSVAMKDPSRTLLLAGVAVAALLAGAGGFLFFANVPEPGAAREEQVAAAPPPQMQRADIDKIIAERNAFAPKPSGITRAESAFSKAADEGLIGSLSGEAGADAPAETRDSRARLAATPAAPAAAAAAEEALPAGDDLFRRGLYPEALSTWRAAAEQGDRWAAYRLGVEYLDGKPNVVKRDVAEAVKWIRQAAEANEPRAQFEMGSLYEYGTGVPADLEAAAQWYLKAAERGHVQGQYNIATMLETGEGIAADRIEALKYFTLAAEQGFSSIPLDDRGQVDQSAPDARERLRAAMPVDEVAEAERRASEFAPIRD